MTDKEMETPLVLSENDETNPVSNWSEFEKPPASSSILESSSESEDNDEEVRGDYVGHRAALLTTLAGVCIVFQILSIPGALIEQWSTLEVIGTYYTNGTQSNIWDLDIPTKSGQSLFQLIKNFGKIDMPSLAVLGVISAFVIPFICINLNCYLAWAVHKLSVNNACILSKQEWRLRRSENPFAKFCESLATHKKVDAVLTFVEYAAKLSLYVVYFPAFATACLSAFPIVLNGYFNPHMINNTMPHPHIHQYNTTHHLEVRTNMYITFGQFFYMLGAGFIVFTAILVRFQWYSNRPLREDISESGYNQVSNDDELRASAFGKSSSNPQQAAEVSNEEGSHSEKPSWDDFAKAKPETGDVGMSNKGGADGRLEWELSQNGSSAQSNGTASNSRYDFWMKSFIFESGLLSLLLVAPISILPMTRFHYSGLYQPLVKRKMFQNTDGLYTTSYIYTSLKTDHTLTLSLWDIALEFAKNSGISNLCRIVISFFWIQVCIFPFVTLLLGVMVNLLGFFWTTISGKRKKIFGVFVKLLRASYTGSNITTFSVTILSGVKVLPYLFENVYNKDKYCDFVRHHTVGGLDKKCLEIDAEPFAGSWYLLAWGLSLDVFTSLTLHYYQTKII